MVLNSLSEAIEKLEAAYDGVTMRSALVDLSETLGTLQGNDTKKLGNLPIQQYVLKTEVAKIRTYITDQLLKYDTIPKQDQDGVGKVMKNKDITTFFGDILEDLKKINGDKDGDYSKATNPTQDIGKDIEDCLNILNTILGSNGLIEDAINEKATGESSQVHDTDSIEDYAMRIDNIKFSVLDIKPYTATEDGEEVESDIIRDHDGNIISGHAYNPVTVNVQLKGQTKTLTETGNNTPDEGYDGFSSVTINVNTTGTGSGGGSGSGDGSPNLTTITITKNGEYGKPSNYDGYSEVEVEVTEYDLDEQEELTVTFVTDHDDGTTETLDTQQVLTGEDVHYDGPTPQYQSTNWQEDGYYFDYWSPKPTRVMTDMTCKAVYGKAIKNNGSYFINDITYCNDSWYEILNGKNGVPVNPMGTVKPLHCKDGTNRRIYFAGYDDSGSVLMCSMLEPISVPSDAGWDGSVSWNDSYLRGYLNSDFISDMFPDWFASRLDSRRYSHYDPIADVASQFQKTTGSILGITGYMEYDPSGTKIRSSIKYEDAIGGNVPVVGCAFKHAEGRVWIPGMDELGIADGHKGDFTNDIYHVGQTFTWDDQPNPAYNTYKRIGMKENVNYPSMVQTGLFKINDRSAGDITGSLAVTVNNILWCQGCYSPSTNPKSRDIRDIWSENHHTLTAGWTAHRTGYDKNAVMNDAPGRLTYGVGNNAILLRDRVVKSCTLIGEQWGTPQEHYAPIPDHPEEEYLASVTNKVQHENWDVLYTTGQTSVTINGCWNASASGARVYPCFALTTNRG